MNPDLSLSLGIARALALMLLMGSVSVAAHGQTSDVAGWVEPDSKTQMVPTAAFRLDRAGKVMAYPEAGLLACDKLTLLDDKSVVRVRLTSNLRMQLDSATPGRQIEVPCDQRGIASSLAAALRALIVNAEQRKSRVAALTRDIAPLALPVLSGAQTNIVGGQRALFLAWTGGAGPFSVQIVNAADGKEVTGRTDIRTRSTSLPVTVMGPGHYTLWVRNRAGHRVEGIREDALMVLPQDALPGMPEVLAASGLPTETRTLFYADFLAALDDGRWTLEALQQVVALKSQSAAVRQWLGRYGSHD